MPHIHSMSSESGTNFIYSNDGYAVFITSDKSVASVKPTSTDYAGIKPTTLAYDNAYSSMCCITKGTYQGTEYVVTNGFTKTANTSDNYNKVEWSEGDYKSCITPFLGISSVYTLDKFNSNLMTTMSSIYGYNPELYPRMVKVGDIYVTDNKVSFNSNIVASDATLSLPSDKFFSHYIAFGGVYIYDYLSKLKKYSNIEVFQSDKTPIEQVNIQPNLKLCGGESSRVLLTSLTYNTPKPNDINISFDSNVAGAVRHSDGTIVPIKGAANPDVLYGWSDDEKCLVELDVSNYKIDTDGTLKLITLPPDKFKKNIQLKSQNLCRIHKSLVRVHIDWGDLTPTISIDSYGKCDVLLPVVSGEEYIVKTQVYLDDQPYPYGFTTDFTVTNKSSSNINVTISTEHETYKLSDTSNIPFENSSQFSLIADGTGSVKLRFDYFFVIIDPPNYGPDVRTVFKTWNQWWLFDDTQSASYCVNSQLQDRVFSGSTITINDLEYEGKNTSHRLFMRDLPITVWEDPNDGMAHKIYYRPLEDKTLWTYNTNDINVLTMVAGPGYDNIT